jgi:ribosomal protein S18 acetylase RimI-like enzyme
MILPVRLRPARAADAPAIAEVYVDAWRSAYPGLIPNGVLVRMSKAAQAREWTRALGRRDRDESVIVAELAQHAIIGFGSCGEARQTSLPQAGEIFTLYMTPEYQNRGVGRALVLRLFDELSNRGLHSVVVWVLAKNPARFFYEALGARRIAERTETLWNTELPQTAYGWDDVRSVPRRRSLPLG